jgi:queuosine precursor transporter
MLAPAIVTQWLVKSVYEALATPLTYAVVNFLKRAEGIDHYDLATRFNPFRITG